MKKTTFFKSLLVAAGLLMGANAWADKETVTVLSEDYESYAAGDITATMQGKGWTFQSRNGKNQITIIQGSSEAVNSTKYFDFYYPDGGASRNQSWNFGTASSLNEDNWKLSFSVALNPGTNNSANKFYIVGTKTGQVTSANNAITNPLIGFEGTAAAAVTYVPLIGNETYSDETITLENGAWYNFSIEASNITETTATITVNITSFDGSTTVWSKTVDNLNISSIGILQGICWNSPRGYSRLSLDNVLLTKEDDASVCAAPTYTITGANGTARKFTLACETVGATVYYATTELAKGAAGWTEYTSEVTTDAATVYAYAVRGAVSSDIISFSTGAGTAISLNTPNILVSEVSQMSDGLQVKFDASYQTAGVQFTPEATLTAKFTTVAGVTTNVTLPFTVEENGTLTVTASSEGFVSAETSVPVYAKYTQNWQSLDFSSINDDADEVVSLLGDGWGKLSGTGRWASWSSANEPYTYYQYTEEGVSVPNVTVCEKLRMRNVVLLNVGYGLGRNVTGGEPINVYYTKPGDLVAFKMYKGYGNAAPNDENTYLSYALNDGNSNPSIMTTNGALLVQATVYSPASVTATIGATGFTTFASAYPLDLGKLVGFEAYYASAASSNSVTLTQTTGQVVAGTGIILKGTPNTTVTIPVFFAAGSAINDNLLVGCTKATTIGPDATCYVLVNEGGTAEFQSLENYEATIPAGKAYLKVSAATARLTITFEDTTTGISSIAQSVDDGTVYNLQGQRVVNAQKGLFIVNGRKVVLK